MSEVADNHSESAEISRDMFEVVPGVKLPSPPDAGKARPVRMNVVESSPLSLEMRARSSRGTRLLSPFSLRKADFFVFFFEMRLIFSGTGVY